MEIITQLFISILGSHLIAAISCITIMEAQILLFESRAKSEGYVETEKTKSVTLIDELVYFISWSSNMFIPFKNINILLEYFSSKKEERYQTILEGRIKNDMYRYKIDRKEVLFNSNDNSEKLANHEDIDALDSINKQEVYENKTDILNKLHAERYRITKGTNLISKFPRTLTLKKNSNNMYV